MKQSLDFSCAPSSVTTAFDRFKQSNPLLVRKQFSVKDQVYRRESPDVPLFETALAFDVEWYLLIVALAVGSLALAITMTRAVNRRHLRSLERRLARIRKHKS